MRTDAYWRRDRNNYTPNQHRNPQSNPLLIFHQKSHSHLSDCSSKKGTQTMNSWQLSWRVDENEIVREEVSALFLRVLINGLGRISTRGRLLSSSPLGAATSCSKNRIFPWGGIGASINSCAAYLHLAALLRSGAGAQLIAPCSSMNGVHLRRLCGAIALCSNPPRAAPQFPLRGPCCGSVIQSSAG